MIDKKLYEAINKNNKIEHAKYVKNLKKQHKKDIIHNIIGILAFISLLFILGSAIYRDTQKAVKKCLKNGNDYQVCLRDAQ